MFLIDINCQSLLKYVRVASALSTFFLVQQGDTFAGDMKEQQLCDNVVLIHSKAISFTANEKKLLCGIETYESWKTIPANQTTYFARIFLQDRGFHSPSFKVKNETLYITAGKQTEVTAISVTAPGHKRVNPKKKRKIVGKPMTPARLDEVKSWASNELKNHGYPCPETTVSGYVKSGEIELTFDADKVESFGDVLEDDVAALEPGVLQRFYPFSKGDPYQVFKTSLAANRMEFDGIVQNAHLVTQCGENQEFQINQYTVAGKPRLFMLGVGVDTEGGVLAKTSFKLHRINSLGSSFTISLFGSFIEQSVETTLDWYIFKPPSRWYLRPSAKIERRDENQYELISERIQFGPAIKWDRNDWFVNMLTGLRSTWTRTFEGGSDENTRFVSAFLEVLAMTHDFEFFQTTPRSGTKLALTASFNHADAFSTLTAQVLSLSGEKLWNLGGFSPPWFVFGTRFGIATTLTDKSDPRFSLLPPTFLHFLGGSKDLRGFGRQSLPRETTTNPGALTAAFIGAEIRLVDVLPFGLQPLLFGDAGMTGLKTVQLDETIYWNPGFGLRLQSFIGVLRATLAYGLVNNSQSAAEEALEGLQFFFSFGEEF